MDHRTSLISKFSNRLQLGLLFFSVWLLSHPALAQSSGPSVFGDFGSKLESLARGIISDVGMGATLLGGAWAVIAWMGRLGHFSAAIAVFVGGLFLSQLETIVTFFFN